MKVSKLHLLFILLAFCVLNVVSAQSESSLDSLRIEEIVITHSKISSSKKNRSKNLQIINENDISNNKGKDLSTILRDLGGLLINGVSSNPGKDKILYLQGAGGEYTLILLNGIPMIDPSGIGGSFDLRLFPVDQIRRIEILNGSASNLYGSEAIAGVINILTIDGYNTENQINGNLSYGSYEQFNSSLSANANWNNIQCQLSATYQESGGISEASDRLSNTEFKPDGNAQLGLFALINYKPSELWEINPFFRFSDYFGEFDDGAFKDGQNNYTAEVFHQGVKTKFSTQNASWEGSYHYTESHRKFETSFGVSDFKGKFHQAEINTDLRIIPNLYILAGVNFQHLAIEDSSSLNESRNSEIISPFFNTVWTLNDLISIEAGYRFNHHSSFGSHSSFSSSIGYWLKSNMKIYAAMSNGFKAPGLFQLYGQFGANPNLNAQTSLSFESGISYEPNQSSIDFQLNYFNRKIEDIIVYSFVQGYFNQDKQLDQGINTNFRINIHSSFQFKANYEFLAGESHTNTETGQDSIFHQLLRRPKHRFSLAVEYQLFEDLFINLQWNQIGSRPDVYFNPINFFAQEQVNLPSHHQLDLSFRLAILEEMGVYLQLNNITNQSFEEVYGFSSKGFNVLTGFHFKL